MNRVASPGLMPGSIPVSSTENLLGIRGGVDVDGSAAYFDVAFTNQHAFRAAIPFDVMPHVFAEIRTAAAVMLRRQALQVDRGARSLLELCDAALRPEYVDVVLDPLTHDRLFIHYFDNHAPIVFRLGAMETHTHMTLVRSRLAQMQH